MYVFDTVNNCLPFSLLADNNKNLHLVPAHRHRVQDARHPVGDDQPGGGATGAETLQNAAS